MCGIAGMVSLSGRPLEDVSTVRHMMDSLAHRGPDEEGLYLDPAHTAALGHRRLRIIDLSTGQQPMANETGRLWVSFNGEIYGFQELRARLQAQGCRFRTASDTEVILHLFEREGLEGIQHLSGMFAFALWDERDQHLVLARDRIGKKPLYYAVADGTLVFSSELQALMVDRRLSRRLDDEAVDVYLTLGYIPAPRTIYQQVKKLEAGQYLSVSNGQHTLHRYWRPDWAAQTTVGATSSMGWQDAKEELVRRLRASTRLRMVSDVPIGCFLSGGVDSSTVLSFMAELSAQPVRTFSIGFPEAEYSELPYARTVARHFGTDHHEFVVQPDGIDVLDRLVRHFGEPFADSSALPTWYLSELTRKSVTVALSGDGGDELFGGYAWYKTAQFLQAAALPGWTARASAVLARRPGRGLLRRVGKAAQFLAASPGRRHAWLRQTIAPEVKDRLYTSAFRARVQDHALDWLADYHDSLQLNDPLNRMMATDLATYMADDLLVKVDRMTMAHALECRSPLLDTDLVGWVLSLPSEMKLPGRRVGRRAQDGKLLLREAVRNRFPAGFLERPKQGFSVPLERWFQQDLRGVVTERVLHGPLGRLGLFQPAELNRAVDAHFKADENHASMIWALLVLATWAAHTEASA